ERLLVDHEVIVVKSVRVDELVSAGEGPFAHGEGILRSIGTMKVDAVILAGGKGARMGGVCKALLRVAGWSILERQVAVLRPLVGQIFIARGLRTEFLGLPGCVVIPDRQGGKGPLAGLEAAFAASTAEALFVVGCDFPFLAPRLVKHFLGAHPDAHALVPRV